MAASSIEEMLASLGLRNSPMPDDLPPALPARPTPRTRRPSARRAMLPDTTESKTELSSSDLKGSRWKKSIEAGKVKQVKPGESEIELSSSDCNVNKGDSRWKTLGAQNVKQVKPGESPYLKSGGEKPISELASSSPGSRVRESEWHKDKEYFLKKNLLVWCRLQNGPWESGEIQSTSGDKASVLLPNGTVATISKQDILPANPDILEGVDDLIQLSYLNDPSILHNIHYRYTQDIVYSKAGPVLVAVNPFKDVRLYGDDFFTGYRQKLLDKPHVYAIPDRAYNEMMTDERNQSLVISGESGAGKTETAKLAMQYLAALDGGIGGIESEFLQTSSILEAFGNAKTARNDNSSRFGKLIEIHFSATGKICGAKIQTFLLEKSRVVQLAHGERSYHIFYQLCAGAPSDLKGRLSLKRACDYAYLNQSDCLEIHGVDDARNFHKLMEALNVIGICNDDQEEAFKMIAAVLWLGDISFIDNENHIEVVADEAVTNVANLIGCGNLDLMHALSTQCIQAGKDKVAKMLTLQQANDTRDSLAKFIHASLFDWIVEKINLSLARGKQHTGRSISILDIYGFESFKKNSFEQFCINYANERLQQHFNRHLFKLEQEEYELDGIDWRKVDFEDNQECLDLFEKKPLGLISLLDEDSNFPKATSLTFANKLKQHLKANQCFKGEGDGSFTVFHYAGEVLYDTGEFLEKNRDPLPFEIIELLSLCKSQLPQLFALKAGSSLKRTNSSVQLGIPASQKQSVISKFKDQLFKLMQQLESTTPHFIRCIKPNNKKIPGEFEKDLVSEQLRCCGILEVVRISRSGYPTRITHQEFTRRYGILLPDNNVCQDPLSTSIAILQQFDIHPEMYQVGYKKLYFQAGQIGALEDVRKQVLKGTLEVQKHFRGHLARRNFYKLKGVATTLQSYAHGEIVRREYIASLRLKKKVACDKLEEQAMAVLQIQSVIRGWMVQRHFSKIQDVKESDVSVETPERMSSEGKVVQTEMLPLDKQVVQTEMTPLEIDLQRRLLIAEVNLGRKEKENVVLREQLQQYEAKWLEHETKMKNMEEMWHNQMAALQKNMVSTRKSIRADRTTDEPKKPSATESPRFFDCEETSLGAQVPKGGTSGKFPTKGTNAETSGDNNRGLDLAIPVEQKSQELDNETQTIDDVKPEVEDVPLKNSEDEVQRNKNRFGAWKIDLRGRFAKSKVQKPGYGEGEKIRRKWNDLVSQGGRFSLR